MSEQPIDSNAGEAEVEIPLTEEVEETAEQLAPRFTSKNHTGKLPDDLVRKWLKDREEFIKLWNDSKDYDIQVPDLIELGFDEPFLGSLCRRIDKVKTAAIPTAGVRIVDGRIELSWNPIFFKHELKNVNRSYPRGVLKHELFHIIFEHCTGRRQEPHVLWNAAADCAINSLIPKGELPDFCLMPGELYVPPERPDDWEPSIIAKIIAGLPKEQTAEFYMSTFLQNQEIQEAMARAREKAKQKQDAGSSSGQGSGEGGDDSDNAGDESDSHSKNRRFEDELSKELYGQYGGGQFDEHGESELSQQERDMMREYIRDMIRNSAREAESRQNGWGSVPEWMRAHIRKMLSKEVDWRELINQFIGRSRSTTTTSSLKRINRRAPWDYPGRKRSYSARPAIAMDQSGSVSDEWVALLFAEVSNLGNLVEYDIIPFDYVVDEKNIQSVRRGQQPNLLRTLCGGTSFDAPVEYINNNPGKYDCLFILTDGGCSEPRKCNIPIAYILTPGCKLCFDPGETPVIYMTDTRTER